MLAGLLSLALFTAAPEQAATVTLGASASDAALIERVRAELAALGYQVTVTLGELEDPSTQLLQLARDQAAVAAIWIDSHEDGVTVWLEDRVTGKMTRRSLATPQEGTWSSHVLAHRTVEILRTSLAEIESSAPPPEAEVAAPPATRRLLRELPHRFELGLGPAVLGSLGGVHPTAQIAAELRFLPVWRAGLVLHVLAPASSASRSAEEGAVQVWTTWFSALAHVELVRPHRVVRPHLGAGVGMALFALQGSAAAPYAGRRDIIITGLGLVRFGIDFAVHPRLRLGASGWLGAALPQPVIRFDGREVAGIGPPIGVGTLTLKLLLR